MENNLEVYSLKKAKKNKLLEIRMNSNVQNEDEN